MKVMFISGFVLILSFMNVGDYRELVVIKKRVYQSLVIKQSFSMIIWLCRIVDVMSTTYIIFFLCIN